MDVSSGLDWQFLCSSTSYLHGSLWLQLHLARVHEISTVIGSDHCTDIDNPLLMHLLNSSWGMSNQSDCANMVNFTNPFPLHVAVVCTTVSISTFEFQLPGAVNPCWYSASSYLSEKSILLDPSVKRRHWQWCRALLASTTNSHQLNFTVYLSRLSTGLLFEPFSAEILSFMTESLLPMEHILKMIWM